MKNENGWELRKLDELGFVGRGKSRHRPRNEPSLYGGSYPFIQTAEVRASDLYIKNYTQTYSEIGLAQSKMWEPNTLCIINAGENTGESAILDFKACFPDSIIAFIPDQKKADVRFIKYYLDYIKPQIRSITKGATQDNLSVSNLLSFDIPTPCISTQRKIAEILSSYDALIENNNARIETLANIGRVLYDRWFIHFQDTEKTNGNKLKSSAGISNSWKKMSIMAIPFFRFIKENARKFEGEKRYFATADIEGMHYVGDGISYGYENKPSRAQKRPTKNSVWFARMQNTYKVISFSDTNRHLAEQSILSSGFAGFEAVDERFLGFLYFTINSKKFHTVKDKFCTGATQMSLTNEGLSRIEIPSPDERAVIEFGEIANHIIDMILILQLKNQNLPFLKGLFQVLFQTNLSLQQMFQILFLFSY
ncbi:MAG: hypothetical protein UX64_C0015G0009 [Microgenomates group bacterium GW2011_GWC2_46_7]|nr:MAG: hypothetical protein UX64_C0015G0009 [Microgenomates group bacterium GW2011_GWC2_46_7]